MPWSSLFYFWKLFFFIFISHFITNMSSGKLRSHNENRAIICATCGKKDLKCFKVNTLIKSIIQSEIAKSYFVADIYFPSGVCSQCRKWLYASKKGQIVPETVHDRWNSINFEEFRPPSRSTPCSCIICKRARFVEVKLDKADQADLPRKKNDDPEAEEARMKKKLPITFFLHSDEVIVVKKKGPFFLI